MKNAGVKGQKMVFLLTDAQIKDEAFLEDVDSILNTGEVPNIFAVDEKQEIMEVRYRQSKCKNYKSVRKYFILFLWVLFCVPYRLYGPLLRLGIKIWTSALWLCLLIL